MVSAVGSGTGGSICPKGKEKVWGFDVGLLVWDLPLRSRQRNVSVCVIKFYKISVRLMLEMAVSWLSENVVSFEIQVRVYEKFAKM